MYSKRNKTRTICILAGIAALLLMQSVIFAKPATKNRDEIPQKYKWNFADIYPDWKAWEAGKDSIEVMMSQFAGLRGTLTKGPDAVLNAYKLNDKLNMVLYKVYRYPQLMSDADKRKNEVSAHLQQVQLLLAKFGTATAWFNPELLSIPWATMEKWLKDTPALAPYKFGISDIFRKQKHVLDERGEQLISYYSSLSGNPSAVYDELSTSDIKFKSVKLSDGKDVTLTPGEYNLILNNYRNQKDRQMAFEGHYQAYADNANTYASIYNGICQADWANAQARNYPTTLEASIDGYNVPKEVVTSLISNVRAGTEPMKRYFGLRKKALKLDSYHLYDGAVPVVEFSKTYDYDTVLPWIVASVAPLGKEYQDKMRKAQSSGWIDVFETEGKTSGAYSAGVYGVHPYMLINYNETMDAVFTLAHELGHTMHTTLTQETQPFATSDYTLFVAEVASTFNEALFLDYMLKKSNDPKERIKLLEQAIDNLVGTFYTQVMFADFELQAHQLAEKGQPITADALKGIYNQIMTDYFGDSIVKDELYGILWSRISHFYNSPYYVFQYATCFASSAKLVKDVTTGDAKSRQAATDRYLTLLKSGGNDYPMEQLKKAGVDLSTSEPFQAVVAQMTNLVNQFEKEMANIK